MKVDERAMKSWGFLAWRRLREDLLAAFQYLKAAYRKSGEGILIRTCSNRMRENASKLEVHRFRVDIRILGSSSLL